MVTPATVIYWVDEAAEIQIRGGICSCRVISGETIIEVRARIPTLLQSIGNGTQAIADDQRKHVAKLLCGAFGKRRQG